MPQTLISEDEVNIFYLPNVIEEHLAEPNTQITIGDLHANAIKLLFLLARHGVIKNIGTEEAQKSYATLVEIYKKDIEIGKPMRLNDTQLSGKTIDLFNECLNTFHFEAKGTILLIGDELSDRGANDYFILKILQKMKQDKIKFKILLSNHSIEFINAYETGLPFDESILQEPDRYSMLKLHTLIAMQLVDRKEIDTIMEHVYAPALKLLSYTLNDEKTQITLYSHAPIGLDLIKCLAARLGVTYVDETSIQLAQTIDAINVKFQKYVQRKEIHTLYTEDDLKTGYALNELDHAKTPIAFLAWNRSHLPMIEAQHEYSLQFVHGHDPEVLKDMKHVFNLDNALGKTRLGGIRFKTHGNEGLYTVLYSENKQARLGLTDDNIDVPAAVAANESLPAPSHYPSPLETKEKETEPLKDDAKQSESFTPSTKS